MRVAVLGCGPTGLFAAAGAIAANAGDVRIFSIKRKSHMYGCQYLHQPIPGYSPPESRSVRYIMQGTAEGYRRKVYGDNWSGPTSPEDLMGDHEAWDMRETYDRLWGMLHPYVINKQLDPDTVYAISGQADLVISSIHRNRLCVMGHSFMAQDIWAAGEAPEEGIILPYGVEDETVLCDGTPGVSWYRLARVFGRTTVEWPLANRPPLTGVARVAKPLRHNCDCWGGDYVFVGRYGAWDKSVLSHQAYSAAYTAVAGLAPGGAEMC